MKHTEIVDIIQQTLEEIQEDTFTEEVGKVISVYEGVCLASGLKNAFLEEVLEFESGLRGIISSLNTHTVSILVLGDYTSIKSGEEIRRTRKFLQVRVSEDIIGRVLDGYGEPVDDKGHLSGELRDVFAEAIPMIERGQVEEQLFTGVRIVDWLTPVGLGQRQLILGNRCTGKTSLAIDTMINSKDTPNVISIYVSVGQRIGNAPSVYNELQKNGVKNFLMLVANCSDPVSMRYLAPYYGCAIAEYFRDRGKHAVIFFDDLTSHANSYREICLIMKRPPGREAFPGDIFYIHSSLLERAAKLSLAKGGGSLTAFPIAETLEDDISAYIPTNLISITDGQIILGSEEFLKNTRPAVKIGVSVSRLGGAVQPAILKKLCGSLKLTLARFEDYEKNSRMTHEFNPEVKMIIAQGYLYRELMKQINSEPTPYWQQILLITSATKGYLTEINQVEHYVSKVKKYKSHMQDISLGKEEVIDFILAQIAEGTHV